MNEKNQKKLRQIEDLQCRLWNCMRWYWKIALKRDVEGKSPHMLPLRPFYAFDKFGHRYLIALKQRLVEG